MPTRHGPSWRRVQYRRHVIELPEAVLGEMARGGGRDTERDLYGRPGGYLTRCSRHTLGTSCGRCGSSIVRAQYLGGAVYLCPGCQPMA